MVWTRFAAERSAVWSLMTDPIGLPEGDPPLWRWTPDDPVEWRAALDEGRTGLLRGTLRLGLVSLPLGSVIERVEPERQVVERADGAFFPQLLHRRRLEPAIGGHIRYVDELVFTTRLRPGRLGAELLRRAFVRRHQAAAQRLPADPESTGGSRLYHFDRGGEGHLEDQLGTHGP